MRRQPSDPMIRELVTRARASVVGRRAVLAGALAAGTSFALAACATTTPGVGTASAVKDSSASVKQFAWQNFPRFLDELPGLQYPTLAAFRTDNKMIVDYHPTIEGNDAYYAEVKTLLSQGSSIGADAVTLTDWMVGRWIGLGYAQRLDHGNIPNLSNLSADLKDPTFDPAREHTVPWNSGFTGLVWNTAAVPRGLGDVIDLWRPELKGKVGVLSDMRDTLGLIMLSLGTDISSDAWGESQFSQAIAELEKYVQNGQIKSIKGSDYLDDLRSGRVIASMAWSGDVEILNAEAGYQKFIFGLPGTGGALWTTDTLVPIGSTEKTNVEKLMNYYLEPEIAATVAAYTNYIPPVDGAKAAMEKIHPALASSEMIFPSDQTLSTVKRFRNLTSAEQSKYLVEFQGVLLAG
jgi:spermidine/putrescine transport system substrate-binding protein